MPDVATLTALYRLRARDKGVPQHYTDAEVLILLNEAEREACRRGLILRDERTNEVCRYAIAVGNPWVKIDPRVIKIFSATICTLDQDDLTVVLRRDPIGAELQDDLPSNWRERSGTPDLFVVDNQINTIRLVPSPNAVFRLEIGVVRTPLNQMEGDGDEPEIPERYHDSLVPWVVYRAASIPDTDLFDLNFAGTHLAEFTAAFGPPVSVDHDLWIGNRGNTRRSKTHFF